MFSQLIFAENSFDEIISACRKNTSNTALEVICIENQVSPKRSELCKKSSYSNAAEKVCLNLSEKTQDNIIQGCKEGTSTNNLQVYCLENLVSPEKASPVKSLLQIAQMNLYA